MASCCEQPLDCRATPPATLTIALAGNPNSGKSTIFNALTGLRQKVANYPGVTVEKKTGKCRLHDGRVVEVIDVPGTYSLISRSPDEQVAMEVLRGLRSDAKGVQRGSARHAHGGPVRQAHGGPDAIVVVVDASNLQRNLYLVSQLIELGRPLVVALNMMDVAERRGLVVSAERLQQELGVPVVPVVGYKRRGISELKAAIANAAVARMPAWPLPQAMKDEVALVGGGLAILHSAEGVGLQITVDGVTMSGSRLGSGHTLHGDESDDILRLNRYRAVAERLLIGDRAADLGDIADLEPVKSLLSTATNRLASLGIDPMQADVEAHYRWIEEVAGKVLSEAGPPARNRLDVLESLSPGTAAEVHRGRPSNLTQRADAILIHKFWGLLIFALIMAILFVTIFWAAQPMMDAIQSGVAALGGLVTRHLGDGPFKDLMNDGVFGGVGTVVVFVPQIALLFLFLAILEDSGYLARAAFLMDRLLARVGLHGKSFIPLLSSFACAIPGIMATRTIENRKDRLATILVAPFMSCSARLPVYTLLIGTFFLPYGPLVQAGIMLGCYALGIVAAAGTAWVFKRSLLKGPTPAFILEMPTYKLPQVSQIARQVFSNTSKFLTKAGTTIFCLSILLWAMAYYPRLPESRVKEFAGDDNALAAAQSEYSLAGRLGHAMEPVIRPLGYDWKMGVGLVGAFAAREVFVSTMGITYSAGKVEGDETKTLSSKMQADHYSDGKPVWTPVVAISLLVWFVLAMQCMSTVAIVRRETGGWGWPIFMIVYMNGLAYVMSLIIYQVGTRLF